MATRQKQRPRRTARRWAREVRAWKRSGLTAKEYAAAHDLLPSTLGWWSWRLNRDAAAGEEKRVHLVEVEVEPSTVISEGGYWEVASANGDVLRVHSPLSVDMAKVVVMALTKATAS